MSTRRTKVALPVSPRAPTKDGLLDWVQKELHQFLIQVRDVINNLSDTVGSTTSDTYKVKVDVDQTPVYGEAALVAGVGVTITKAGATPGKTLTLSATGDHKFSTDSTDEAAGGAGFALSKLSSTGNVKPTLDTTSSQRRTRLDVTLPTGFPGFYEDDPEPVGISDPGDSPLTSHGNHSHEGADAVVAGSYLYTTRLPDPLERPVCRALSFNESASYGLALDYGWTKIDGISTWRKNSSIPVKAYVGGAGGDFPFDVGDRFYVANMGNQAKYNGPYEVLEQGNGSTGASVIRRTSDANTVATLPAGMACQITGTGVYRSGDWAVLDNGATEVDVTELAVSFTSSFAPAVTYGLLTPAQLVSEAAPTDTYVSDTTITSAYAPWFVPGHTTLPGTPNLAEIPAGRYSLRVKYRRQTDAADVTRFEYRLYTQTPGGSPDEPSFLSLWSPPLHATSDTLLEWEADLAAAVATTPEKEIVGRMYFHTDSAAPVTIYWTWNDAARSTRLGTPWQNPVVGGTNWHPDLLGRSEVDQHPWSSMEPVGMARVPFLSATLAEAYHGGNNENGYGKLALGASNRYLVNPNGLSISQIQTPIVAANVTVEIMLMFTAPILVIPNDTPDAGYTKLIIAHDESFTGQELENEYSWMAFIYVDELNAWVKIGETTL